MSAKPKEASMTRRVALPALALLAMAALASGTGRPKHAERQRPSAYRSPYFAATVPGAWSRYTVTSDGKTESTYTYRRLPDEDGRAQVELRTDFLSGPSKGTWSTNRYVLSKSFRLEDDALSFGKHPERLFMRTDTMAAEEEMPKATLPNIIAAGVDYGHSVRFAGTATIDGKECDHYTYRYVSKEKNRTIYDGEVWLNASVPFGLVRESASLKPKYGPSSKYSMTLAATGTGPDKAE
jgi:hypothetical protein